MLIVSLTFGKINHYLLILASSFRRNLYHIFVGYDIFRLFSTIFYIGGQFFVLSS